MREKPLLDLLVIAGAPGSGKTTVSDILYATLQSPYIDFGDVRNFHLDRQWSNQSPQEEQMSFENLVYILKNYIRYGYKKEVSGKPRFLIVGKNGERTEIELLYNGGPKYPEGMRTSSDISNDERDNKNFVMTFERGNFNTANGVVRFGSFTVGKPKGGNLLVSRTHRKVSEVQRTFPR